LFGHLQSLLSFLFIGGKTMATILTLTGAGLLSIGSSAILVVQNPGNLADQGRYKLRYLVTWTDATGVEPLSIQLGASGTTPPPVTVPVWDSAGNPVTIGQFREEIRRREYLKLIYVAATTTTPIVPAHFVVVNCLYPQVVVTPRITPLAVPQGATVAGYTPNGKLSG
jgi:hypothetical protein